MISPTRVPLVTPASRNAAAIACVVASSSPKVTRFTGSMTIGAVTLAPFGAVNNLFDRRYVGSVNINGFGGRVLEPAPGRHGYLGLEVRWTKRSY